MGNFNTKVDFSNQIKEYPNTEGTLSGSVNVQQYTILGTDYSDLPLGLDYSTTGVTYYNIGFGSGKFSGTTGSTTFYFYDSNMDLGIPYLSAITPSNSGLTQNIFITQPIYSVTVDGNYFDIYFSGVTYDITPTIFVEYSSGLYSGSLYTNLLTYVSGTTYPWWFLKSGSTTWNEVKGRLQTDRITITESATTGYVLTCVDSSGKGTWQPSLNGIPFSGGSGNCITDLYVTNVHGCSPINVLDPTFFNYGGYEVYINSGTTSLTTKNGNVEFYENDGTYDRFFSFHNDPGVKDNMLFEITEISSSENTYVNITPGSISNGITNSNNKGLFDLGPTLTSHKHLSPNSVSGVTFGIAYNNVTPGNTSAVFVQYTNNISRPFFIQNMGNTVSSGLGLYYDISMSANSVVFGSTNGVPTAKFDIAYTGGSTNLRIRDGAQDGYMLTSDSNGYATWQSLSTNIFFTDDVTTGTTDTNGYRILYPFTATTSGDYIFDATTRVAIGGASPTGNITTRAVVNGTPVTSNYRSTMTSGEEITHTEKKKLTLSVGDTFHYGVVSPTTNVLDGSMIIYKIS